MKALHDPRISVVVATWRREQVLCDTLEQLLRETYPDFEIIVVDQTEQHEPATVEFLRLHADRIRLFHLDRPSVTAAENYGIRQATGDVVLFLDDDVRITPGLIAAHAANYADDRWTGVGGLVTDAGRGPSRKLPAIVMGSDVGWFFFMHNYARRTEARIAPGGNMSFRRQALIDVGGLDEGFRENAIHWEADLCCRIRQAGGRIIHDPAPAVFHLRAPAGGCRMSGLKSRSFFDNIMRFVFRHLGRHQRWTVLWRVVRDQMLVESGCNPWSLLIMSERFLRAALRVRKNPPKAVLGLKDLSKVSWKA